MPSWVVRSHNNQQTTHNNPLEREGSKNKMLFQKTMFVWFPGLMWAWGGCLLVALDALRHHDQRKDSIEFSKEGIVCELLAPCRQAFVDLFLGALSCASCACAGRLLGSLISFVANTLTNQESPCEILPENIIW